MMVTIASRRTKFATVVTILLAISTVLLPIVSAIDGDGDGLDDSVDDCPFASGNSTIGLAGCPDINGDGNPDSVGAITDDWDLSRRMLYANHGESRALAWAPNSVYLAAAGDGAVILYSAPGYYVSTLTQISENVRGLAFSPNGSYLAVSGYYDENADHAWVLVLEMDWASKSAIVIQNLSSSHSDDVYAVEWSQDGAYLYTACADRDVRRFDTSTWAIDRTYTFLDAVYDIAISPDGRLLGSVHGQDTSMNWTSNGTMAMDFHHHSGTANAIDFSPDGRWLVTGGDDNNLNVYNVSNRSRANSVNDGWRDVNGVSFDPTGGFLAVANDGTSAHVWRTSDWTMVDDFGEFGWNQNTRGVRAIEWSPDGGKIALGQNRGRNVINVAASGFLTLKGDNTGYPMQDLWRYYWPTTGGVIEHDNMTQNDLPYELCSDNDTVGTLIQGISQHIAIPHANWSTSGLLHCFTTADSLIEVPIGRMPASVIVKSAGAAETCLTTIGGLSMAQLRWILSSETNLSLTQTTWAPGISLASVAPDDDGDALREWSDIDSSCAEQPIHVSTGWSNRSISTMLQRLMLCASCETSESFFAPVSGRFRFAEEFPEDIVNGIANSQNDVMLGFAEMRDSVDEAGVWHVPIVDNWTHGAADALAAGGSAVDGTINSSADGTWPVQEDFVFIVPTTDLVENFALLNWLLSSDGQSVWDAGGYVHLGPMARVDAWARIGVDAIGILPDTDNDGLWDGIDDCDGPTMNWDSTDVSLDRDADGCHDATEDDDDDNDGVLDVDDLCDGLTNQMGWISDTANDHDSDGCHDTLEDADDDNDGIGDTAGDVCPLGWSNWTSSAITDHDGDGCADDGEDGDDDDDGISDFDTSGAVLDACPTSGPGWISSLSTDRDGDGCEDTGEDLDDDADGIPDLDDNCDDPGHKSDWLSDTSNDLDQDGCFDATEDNDDDGDGIDDGAGDFCPTGWANWTSDSLSDIDADGCKDDGEDNDDDSDGKLDGDDNCPIGETDWTSTPTTDFDGDGCKDLTEDDDDDDDGFLESNGDDQCPKTPLGVFVDAFGCPSQTEESDYDGDGIVDSLDACTAENATGWDLNFDGCIDDNDSDQIKDNIDDCVLDPEGDSIGSDGCTKRQRDDDSDGVAGDAHGSGVDICPETKDGEIVDIEGCSTDQRAAITDDDKDGISNLDDTCPNTPASEINAGFVDDGVDDDGCSYTQQDADGDKVQNSVDLCPGTPALHQADDNGCSASQLKVSDEGFSTGVILAGFAGGGLLIIGIAVAVIMVLKKTPKPKKGRRKRTGAAEKRRDQTTETSTEQPPSKVDSGYGAEQSGDDGYSDKELTSGDDSGITTDEYGTEWFAGEDGVWWYRSPEMTDWVVHEP